MPIKSILCPCSRGRPQDLDHYQGRCKAPPFPEPRAQQILADVMGDTEHVNGAVTATRVLGCARATVIQDFVPAAYDLTKFEAAVDGTMLHEKMASNNLRRNAMIEFRVEGYMGGFKISAIIDRLYDGEITDWKSTGRYYGSFKPKDEHIVQVNIQRFLVLQNKLGPVKSMKLAYHFWGDGWEVFEAPEMDEEAILAFDPFGSGFRVQENGMSLALAASVIKGGGDAREVAKGLPLAGRKMKMGKGCACDWCPVAWECDRIEGIIGI